MKRSMDETEKREKQSKNHRQRNDKIRIEERLVADQAIAGSFKEAAKKVTSE